MAEGEYIIVYMKRVMMKGVREERGGCVDRNGGKYI